MSKTTEPEVELAPELARVINFKMQWLVVAGYSKRNAELIATTEDVDWHLAVDVMAHCKDEDLAMRVLL